jgi:hypothetical protein
MYGPHNSLVVQKEDGEGGGVSFMCGEMSLIPNGEVIDARSHAGLERRHEGGVLRPFPPQKGECLYVGILRVGAFPAPLNVAS